MLIPFWISVMLSLSSFQSAYVIMKIFAHWNARSRWRKIITASCRLGTAIVSNGILAETMVSKCSFPCTGRSAVCCASLVCNYPYSGVGLLVWMDEDEMSQGGWVGDPASITCTRVWESITGLSLERWNFFCYKDMDA